MSSGANANIFRRGAALPRPVLNIAHRGAASLAPENTLVAARKAYELGADLWECDVRFTKDGVPILMHDATLRRTTDAHRKFPTRGPWWVHLFTLEEIEWLDAGSWFNEVDPFGQIRAGAVPKEAQQAYRGERVPTLERALRFTKERGWRVNLELKPSAHLTPRLAAQRVLEVIQEVGIAEGVLISSYNERVLREVKRLDHEIAIATLVALRPQDPVGYLERLEADAYHPSLWAFNAEDASELRQLGFGVNLWTCDAPDRLRELAAEGLVSGLFTNFPQRLEPILRELFGP
ncbi:MAG: glycerophosphodiester phosphodiesterase [Candidatus Bipolaricaulia bacterium]